MKHYASLAVLLMLAGCDSGYAGDEIFDSSQAKPYAVNMSGADRVDLEIGSQSGPVIVIADDSGIQVLGGCTARGNYAYEYEPARAQEESMLFTSASEVRIWLPLNQTEISTIFGSDRSLGIAMVTNGVRRLKHVSDGRVLDKSVGRLANSSLSGDRRCDGATHFVSAIYVGAFKLASVSQDYDELSFKTSIFGIGYRESEGIEIKREQGAFTMCRKRGRDYGFDDNCGHPLRLEITPIDFVAKPQPKRPPPLPPPHRPPPTASAGASGSSTGHRPLPPKYRIPLPPPR